MDSSLAEIFIEFKWDTGDDPFSTGPTFLHDSKNVHNTLGQITSYVGVQLGAQFQMHVYFVFILQKTARILRWDRSGAIVMDAFEYNTLPHLAKFFCQYSLALPTMHGNDDTVSCPTSSEACAARKALGLGKKDPLVKLSIHGADGKPLYFVTSTPEAPVYAPPGCTTCGFKAYDLSHSRMVFLKDSWRIDVEGIQLEGEVYETLHKAEVPHVPQCLTWGDISTDDYHSTATWRYTSTPWAVFSETPSTHFLPHQHYRLTLDIGGHTLVEYHSSYEMVSTVQDGIIGVFPKIISAKLYNTTG